MTDFKQCDICDRSEDAHDSDVINKWSRILLRSDDEDIKFEDVCEHCTVGLAEALKILKRKVKTSLDGALKDVDNISVGVKED